MSSVMCRCGVVRSPWLSCSCDKNRHFQRHQRPPGIAIGHRRPEIRAPRHRSVIVSLPKPRSVIGDRPADQRPDLLFAQRRKLKNLAPADQRRIHRKKRILRRRPHQHDQPRLHIRQQNILLRAIEPVNLIEKQNRPLAAVAPAVPWPHPESPALPSRPPPAAFTCSKWLLV